MRLSIVVPVLQERSTLGQLLDHLGGLTGVHEVIVVDGGSSDGTRELAEGRARLVESTRGRARQMNAGAAVAEGDVLLFLHADTRLPAEAAAAIEAALVEPEVVGGMFSKVVFTEHPLLTISDRLVDWVQRRRPMLLGDRAIFVRRESFRAIGGYRPLEIMEDPDLGDRLAQVGRLSILEARVSTSARRFLKEGVPRTLWLMFWLCVFYQLGLPTAWLAGYYRATR
ncbi:MAG: TIGR04283 family arsenosugar biosynthesis glycosyltransferase [Candidatus Eremiobacteraeota bacterium]|nr:TIGR04283 family arsenosugar biosynthesis glycosyltransferase [Candidatus Eremiobacteraeota bacterium]